MLKSLSSDQYDTFIDNIGIASPRDRSIMLLLLHTGLRNGEVCKLNLGDLYIGSEIVHSLSVLSGHGPSKKPRFIPISVLLVATLREYIAVRTAEYDDIPPADPAFITKNQRIRISPKDVQRIVASYTLTWLGVTFTPHNLRHTFATRLMRVANIRVVQELLGHKTLSSTQVYTHPNSEDRANAIKDAF
ncbi:hypothetical protein LCGC14_1816060 [marine sediment metagenome]|uniref:Tyr recombinase domain-containing protein n=1 Tax=marine sediment metagenome TaxID=412755 RepID=A0A0F9J065_9ZZZZ